MFFSSFTTSTSIAVPTAQKSVSEKLVNFFEALKPDTSYSSRRPPPTFHSSIYTSDPFAPTRGQEFYHTAFYGNSNPHQQKRTFPPPTTRVGTPVQSRTHEVPPKSPNSKKAYSGDSVKTTLTFEGASKKDVKNYKRAAIRCCAASFGQVETSEVKDKNRVVQDFAQRVMKEKIRSKWLLKYHHPIIREMVAAVGKVGVLPHLERYSTSNGLYGVSLLGNGVRSNNLSYGRPRGVPRIRQHVMAVPKVLKKEQVVARMIDPTRKPRTVLSTSARHLGGYATRSSSVKPNTAKITQKPKWVIRNGREDWGKKVEDAIIKKRTNQIVAYVHDSQYLSIRSEKWI